LRRPGADGLIDAETGRRIMEADKQTAERSRRVIKRYSNRKLYDTKDSRYVTLQQIGEMVRHGEDVQIIDNKTKEDKTEVTLALILSEDLRSKPRSVPLGALRTLIQERGGKLLSQLREGPIGRLIQGAGADSADGAGGGAARPSPTPPDEAKGGKNVPEERPSRSGARSKLNELVESSRQTFGELQGMVDERVRAVVSGVGLVRELRAKVDHLTQRVEALETTLAQMADRSRGKDKGDSGGR
jgi:polyhydroxyalkanoate synthesis repressor PhaR